MFSYFNHFLTAQGSDLPFSLESVVPITQEQNIICSKTRLNGTTHEQTSICRQLFAGHVVGSRPMERKKTMRRMVKGLRPWQTRAHCCGHIVSDTNFSSFARARKTQEMFLILFRNILCPLPSFCSPRNIMGNNVFSFARALISRTMVLHVRFESLPSSAKQRREMTKFYVFWRT